MSAKVFELLLAALLALSSGASLSNESLPLDDAGAQELPPLQEEESDFLREKLEEEEEEFSLAWLQERALAVLTVAVLGGEAALMAWLFRFFKDEQRQMRLFRSVTDLFESERIEDLTYERFARILSEMGLSVVYVRDTSLKTLRRLLERERLLFFYRECEDCPGEKYFFVTRLEEKASGKQSLFCFDLDSTSSRACCEEKEIPLADLYNSNSGTGGKLSFLVFLQTEAAELRVHPVIQKLICGRCTPLEKGGGVESFCQRGGEEDEE